MLLNSHPHVISTSEARRNLGPRTKEEISRFARNDTWEFTSNNLLHDKADPQSWRWASVLYTLLCFPNLDRVFRASSPLGPLEFYDNV